MTYFEKKANSGPFFAFRRTDVICLAVSRTEARVSWTRWGRETFPPLARSPKLIRAKKRIKFHLSCQLRFTVNLIWQQLLCAYFGHLTNLWHTVLKRCIFSFCKQVLPAFIKVSKSSRLIVHCNIKRSQTISDKAQLLTMHLSGRGSPTPYIHTQIQ